MLGEYDVCKNCNARFIADIEDNSLLCDDCLKEQEGEVCPIEDLNEDEIKEKIQW